MPDFVACMPCWPLWRDELPSVPAGWRMVALSTCGGLCGALQKGRVGAVSAGQRSPPVRKPNPWTKGVIKRGRKPLCTIRFWPPNQIFLSEMKAAPFQIQSLARLA